MDTVQENDTILEFRLKTSTCIKVLKNDTKVTWIQYGNMTRLLNLGYRGPVNTEEYTDTVGAE